MSKIQEAIMASRQRSQKPGLKVRTGSFQKLNSGVPEAAPLRLNGHRTLALDPDEMERNCLLPFIETKGASKAYMLLRTRLVHRMRKNQWRSVMVAGAVPDDGKTTTAINVAVGISHDVNHAVLLVDLDMERPSIASSLGLETSPGLSDYLVGDVQIEDVIYNTDVERFFVLPNFVAMNSSDSLATPRMLELLEYIKAMDPSVLIVFDLPPILSSDAVLAMAPHIDSLLLVVAEGKTPRTLVKRANQMIEDIPRVGTVLNRSIEGDSVGYY